MDPDLHNSYQGGAGPCANTPGISNGSDATKDNPYAFVGIDVFGAILAGLLFFVVAAWYAAAQDYFNSVRGLPNNFDTSFLFALLWSLFVLGIIVVVVVFGRSSNQGPTQYDPRIMYRAAPEDTEIFHAI